MTERALYVFDLDGTVALLTPKRRAIIEDRDDKDRWRRFYAACVTDCPNVPVINTLHALRFISADVFIWSGRSDEFRAETVAWLTQHTNFTTFDLETHLRMRRAGDYTPDDELKESWLHAMLPADRRRLVATFDDRDKVVAMWRRNDVCCFQVAPGEF